MPAFMDLPDAPPILDSADQQRLLRAIDAAIGVRQHADFHGWMCGPFRTLLPHQRVVCIELGRDGAVQHVESLDHAQPGAAVTQLLGDSHIELALHLVRGLDRTSDATVTIESDSFTCIHAAFERPWPAHLCMPGNALIHRVTFLSGAAYYFVLFDVMAQQEARSYYLLKLLSSHLKMAWSKVIDLPIHIAPPPKALTANITGREREILGLMQFGKSNQEISAALGISPITLKDHIRKIYRKLDVTSRSEALAICGALLTPTANT